MKRYLLFLAMVCCISITLQAQKKNFTYKFYGQLRGDLFYNTRANAELVDGLFHMYPSDIKPDADGNDLNSVPNSSFYLLYSRLGVDVTGPMIGSAKSSAKVEIDFRGSGTNYTLFRIRHAYVNLDWGKSSVLVGQAWHPLFGDVFPSMLNLSTGAPFQPFSRTPQIRYKYTNLKNIELTAAAMWQLQFYSMGPKGKSGEYLKNSNIPEIYVAADYKANGLIAGAGIEMLSLKPRTQSEVGDLIYKVNERITTFSFEAHAKYTRENWLFAARSCLGSNLTQTFMPGCSAVAKTHPGAVKHGISTYRHSMSWVNVVYGKKWQPGIFLGYLKNLGTTTDINGPTYGVGLDVDQVLTANVQFSYNLPNWKLGIEFSPSTAWYGDTVLENGQIADTHTVTNYRFTGVLIYTF